MDMLQERRWMIYHISVISWHMQLLKELLSTGIRTILFFHRYHHVWFDEYNSCTSIEYNHTPGYLLFHQYNESIIHNLDLINLIPCKIDLTYNPFSNTKILTYEIKFPPSGKKIGFSLLDDEDFTIHYVTDTISN